MIDGVIRWSLDNRLFVLLGAALLFAVGGYVASTMPVDVLPDLTAPTVTILTEAPGMDPLEIESLVTFPIEIGPERAAGVRRVRSATAVGVAVVWVEFDWGQDIARARQTVTEKLRSSSAALPPGVEPTVLAPVSSIMGEVLFIDLESDDTTAWTCARPPRPSYDGDCWRCQASRRSSPPAATRSSTRSSSPRAPGVVPASRCRPWRRHSTPANQNTGRALAGGAGVPDPRRRPTPAYDAIGETVVTMRAALPVLVRDSASCAKGPRSSGAKAPTTRGPPSSSASRSSPDVNTLELTARIETTLDDIQRTCRQACEIHRDLFRQADFIEQWLGNLFEALLEGAVLVILVVVLFLMNLGPRHHPAGAAAVAGRGRDRDGSLRVDASTA